jgi:transcriptional regulator NrdR family protein
MLCPCGGDTRVLDNPLRDRGVMERIRVCLRCGKIWATDECIARQLPSHRKSKRYNISLPVPDADGLLRL